MDCDRYCEAQDLKPGMQIGLSNFVYGTSFSDELVTVLKVTTRKERTNIVTDRRSYTIRANRKIRICF